MWICKNCRRGWCVNSTAGCRAIKCKTTAILPGVPTEMMYRNENKQSGKWHKWTDKMVNLALSAKRDWVNTDSGGQSGTSLRNWRDRTCNPVVQYSTRVYCSGYVRSSLYEQENEYWALVWTEFAHVKFAGRKTMLQPQLPTTLFHQNCTEIYNFGTFLNYIPVSTHITSRVYYIRSFSNYLMLHIICQ